MATQKSGRERQTWQSSSSSLLNISTNSLTKSVNGPLQYQSNRSKTAPSKRSVTPISRAHSSSSAIDADQPRRSITPTSRVHADVDHEPVKNHNSKRTVATLSRIPSIIAHDPEPGRVRVAVRLRPRNAEDLASDADFADCVELQPELKKLNLRKNNWNSESYKFDEVFTETASQKRVYEVVVKPVVESVLSGYNGTVMAYGQTGTGKTYTVGNLGKNDASERGIMVRAVEDIIANTSSAHDSVEVSYLQLYMETIQDLLAPEKVNIPIVEDSKTGEVLLTGASRTKLHDLDQLMELLQSGEANRHAANTKLNTNSSRSHAILMVYVKRSFIEKTEACVSSYESTTGASGQEHMGVNMIRKSKLLIVDLAGSERINKSGSEGQLLEEAKFINLSLTSLGKCINALAENTAHIPTRESKLTRILRDSFGGSARTSLIIMIGPSARHHAETTSTIMFGQRAMKVVNTMKVKEEFDYERLARRLESQVDSLTKEIDRQQKLGDNYISQMEKKLKECQLSFVEAEKRLVARSEILEKDNARLEMEMKAMLNELDQRNDCNKLLHEEVTRLEISVEQYKQKQHENSTYQKALADTTQMYEKQIGALINQFEDERAHCEGAERQLDALRALLSDRESSMQECQTESSRYQKELLDTKQTYEKAIAELTKQSERLQLRCEHAEEQVTSLRKLLIEQNSDQKLLSETIQLYERKTADLNKQLQDEHVCHQQAEEEIKSLKKLLNEENESQSQEKSKINDLMMKLEGREQSYQAAVNEVRTLKIENANLLLEQEKLDSEVAALRAKLEAELKQRTRLENETLRLKKLVPENSKYVEDKKLPVKPQLSKEPSSFRNAVGLNRSISGQRATIAKICEEVGLEKILELLSSEDIEVQMHALKLVANLAAEESNQEKIVNGGGLDSLLMLLQTAQNATILRVASGAVANLAMNEANQGLIMSKGIARLLSDTASRTVDPQTLRMVAGAIANLCGNVTLHVALKQGGGIKALLGMARSANADVIAQVARGLANFAKCETREVIQGHKIEHSLLIEDGALAWLIVNSKATPDSTRRHIELALCHLAQNAENGQDFINSGGLEELLRISSESAREDIRNLAKKTLRSNPMFQAHIHADR